MEDFDIFACDGVWDIIQGLDLDEDMPQEEIFERVFDAYREGYDGQVSDVEIIDMCKDVVKDVCEELEIDYKEIEY